MTTYGTLRRRVMAFAGAAALIVGCGHANPTPGEWSALGHRARHLNMQTEMASEFLLTESTPAPRPLLRLAFTVEFSGAEGRVAGFAERRIETEPIRVYRIGGIARRHESPPGQPIETAFELLAYSAAGPQEQGSIPLAGHLRLLVNEQTGTARLAKR